MQSARHDGSHVATFSSCLCCTGRYVERQFPHSGPEAAQQFRVINRIIDGPVIPLTKHLLPERLVGAVSIIGRGLARAKTIIPDVLLY